MSSRARELQSILGDFAGKAAALEGVTAILEVNDTVRIEFPESEFLARFKVKSESQGCWVFIQAAVRAHHPDLQTWWQSWSLASSALSCVQETLDLIQDERTGFANRLAEWPNGRRVGT